MEWVERLTLSRKDIIPPSCSPHLVHLILTLHPSLQWRLVPPTPAFPGLPPELSPLQAKFQLLPLLFLCHPIYSPASKLEASKHLSADVVLLLFFLGFCEGTEIITCSQHHVEPEAQSFCRFSHSVNISYSNYLIFYLISFKRIMSSLILETVIFMSFRNLSKEYMVCAH